MLGNREIKLLTISEQIAEYIKKMIIDGKLKPGEKLPTEIELSDSFQVSRPTVRSALKLLASSNMIITKPGAKGGHFVSGITSQSISDNLGDFISYSLGFQGITLDQVVEMRKLIEIKACALAAKRRTNEDLKNLQNVLNTFNGNLSDQSYFQNDFEFHRYVAIATQNKLIMITTDAIINALQPLFNNLRCPNHLKQELKDHLQSIYNEIENRNPANAVERMNYHLLHFEQYFSETLAESLIQNER